MEAVVTLTHKFTGEPVEFPVSDLRGFHPAFNGKGSVVKIAGLEKEVLVKESTADIQRLRDAALSTYQTGQFGQAAHLAPAPPVGSGPGQQPPTPEANNE